MKLRKPIKLKEAKCIDFGSEVVGMTTFKGRIFIACKNGVYTIYKGKPKKLVPVKKSNLLSGRAE